MTSRAVLAFLAALTLASATAAEIGIGDSRDAVLAQHGKPASIARRGDHEIFLYPKGGRVEFVAGKVADVKGPLPALVSNAAPSPPAAGAEKAAPPAPDAATNAGSTQPAAAANAGAVKKAPTPPPAAPADDYSPAAAANALASHVEKMDTAWGAAPMAADVHSPFDSVPQFLTGLVLRFGLTLLGLKLAFRFWEMDAFWKGIFAIAGIDLALHATFELLGPVTGGLTTMAAVENGVPGLALIYTINRFCFNKRIQNAVVTAAAVKTIVTLCYIFVGVAALNAVFG